MKPFSTITALAASTTLVFGVFGTPAFAHHNFTITPQIEKPLNLAGDIVTTLVGGESTNGQYSILDIDVPSQSGPPLHIHELEDEIFYILEGEVDLQLADKAFTANKGTFAFLPKGIPHAFRNLGTKPARMLAFGTPAGFEHIVNAVATPVSDTPPPPPTDFSFIDDFLRITEPFGFKFPDTLVLPFAATNVNTSTGASVAQMGVLRPGKTQGVATAILTVDDGTDRYSDIAIPVTFAENERFKLVDIPLLGNTTENQTLKVTLTDPREGVPKSLLQNQALITINGTGNPFAGVADLYNLPDLLPNPQQESFTSSGETINFVATGADTNGQLSIFDVSVAPQSTSSVGVHGQADEGFYILSGNASFIVNGETVNASPGTFVYAPAGNTYTLSNSGTTPLEAVLVSAPSGVENHFRNVAKPVPEANPVWGLLVLGAGGVASQFTGKRKQGKFAPRSAIAR